MNRIKALFSLVAKKHVDAIVFENNLELFYLTGMIFSSAQLFVTRKEAYLFTDNRYFDEAKKKVNTAKIMVLSDEIIEKFLNNNKIKKIAFNSDRTSYHHVLELKEKFKRLDFIPLLDPLKEFRMIKDEEEIKALKKAARITFSGYRYLLKKLKVGMTEKEAALLFETYCLNNGADKLAFEPIICFGKNSALPHHHRDDTKWKKGDLVLMDLGVMVDGYCSDMTRVNFFNCEDKLLQEFNILVKEAYDAAVALCKGGVHLNDVDRAARKIFEKHGVDKYFLHRLGHGVGLEIHEYPRIGKDENVILQPNMLITIEPGLYKENIGGIRYENTLIITKDGCEEITALEGHA